MRHRRFYNCELSERVLYTAFLLVMGFGYLMALAYLYASHQGNDGKPGLSINDVAETYYGNRSGTRLEAAIRGPMSGYIDIDQRAVIVAWLKSGAGRSGFETAVAPILQKQCLSCHAAEMAKQYGGLPVLDNYDGVMKVAEVDTGASLLSLVRLSHIHLLGIGLVLLGIGFIFCLAEINLVAKIILIATPFVAIFIDILSWFLTKWDPVYAYTIVIAGGLLGVSMGTQILISLYQIWFLKEPENGV